MDTLVISIVSALFIVAFIMLCILLSYLGCCCFKTRPGVYLDVTYCDTDNKKNLINVVNNHSVEEGSGYHNYYEEIPTDYSNNNAFPGITLEA